MVSPINPAASPVAAVKAGASVAPARRAEGGQDEAAVVTLSAAGVRAAASQDAAKVKMGTASAGADLNQDGTISTQEQQTDVAQQALRKALLGGGGDLDKALQAYREIAFQADAQR
jgi:hypothetical protein